MTADDADPRSPQWRVGWLAGASVVGVAAGLLVTLILLARRIAGQAGEISSGLQRTARATDGLWAVRRLNATLERILTAVSPGEPPATSAAGEGELTS